VPKGLSSSAIAGIVIGSIIGVLALLAAYYRCAAWPWPCACTCAEAEACSRWAATHTHTPTTRPPTPALSCRRYMSFKRMKEWEAEYAAAEAEGRVMAKDAELGLEVVEEEGVESPAKGSPTKA
jgi:hypothetical protein